MTSLSNILLCFHSINFIYLNYIYIYSLFFSKQYVFCIRSYYLFSCFKKLRKSELYNVNMLTISIV